jgi:hypothetical protein
MYYIIIGFIVEFVVSFCLGYMIGKRKNKNKTTILIKNVPSHLLLMEDDYGVE